jgi:hypothetical protein
MGRNFDQPTFGMISKKDRILLQDALACLSPH